MSSDYKDQMEGVRVNSRKKMSKNSHDAVETADINNTIKD